MHYVNLALAVVASAFLGFLAGYMKKKGENLATHEDIRKLVEQMSAVTKATKDIEAKISSDVWDRQKRWELKRDILLTGIKRIAAVDEALMNYKTFIETEKANRKSDEPEWPQGLEKKKQWSKAATDFDETRLLASIICSEGLKHALDSLGVFTAQIAAQLVKNDTEIYDKSHAEFFKKLLAARAAVRAELEIDKNP